MASRVSARGLQQAHVAQQQLMAHQAAVASQQASSSSRRMSYSAQGVPSKQHQQQEDEDEELEEYQYVNEDDMDAEEFVEADVDDNPAHTSQSNMSLSSSSPTMASSSTAVTEEISAASSHAAAAAAVAAPGASASSSSSGALALVIDPDGLEALDEAAIIARSEALIGVDWKLQAENLADMFKKEKKYRVYNGEAKYLKHRRIIVDWMCEVGEEYKLHALTIHCAVRYLDRLLGTVDVVKGKLQLVAMACVLVASKFEEAEDVTPTLADLNECANHAYSIESVKDMEIEVLRALDWSLTVVNPVHFLQFYQARGIVFQNDSFDGGPSNRRAALKYVRKYADFFAELCLQEYAFQQYLPSVLAGAVIASARRAVKISPIWNEELLTLTRYNERQIFAAYKHLYAYYQASFPAAPQAQAGATGPPHPSVIQFEEKAQRLMNDAQLAY